MAEDKQMAMIRKLLEQTAAKQDVVLEAWKAFTREERVPFLNEICKQVRRAAQLQEEKAGQQMDAEEKELQRFVLSELKKKFANLKTDDDAELFGSLLNMGRQKGDVKKSHRTYSLLFPTFQAAQTHLNEKFAEEGEEEEEAAVSNKKAKQKGLNKLGGDSDIEQYETIVSSFALIASLTLSKKKLTFSCDAPGCEKKEAEICQFKKCAKCKRARYCGRDCQVAAWKGGHKTTCGKPTAAANSDKTAETPTATPSSPTEKAAQQAELQKQEPLVTA